MQLRDGGGKVTGPWAGVSVRLPDRHFHECQNIRFVAQERPGLGTDVGCLTV